jgi:hypothetical protein
MSGDAALGAGACAVSGVLGAAPEVADIVLDRYRAAVADQASPAVVARAQLPGKSRCAPLV